MLLHSLPTINIAYSAVLHGIDLRTETHITGTGNRLKEITTFKYSYCLILGLRGISLCGLVVRVSGYRYRGPGFDPRRYQIF